METCDGVANGLRRSGKANISEVNCRRFVARGVHGWLCFGRANQGGLLVKKAMETLHKCQQYPSGVSEIQMSKQWVPD